MIQDFPSEIPIVQIETVHRDYDGELLRRYDALYRGGNSFEKMKAHFLRHRQLEKSGTQGGSGLREARLACASYAPVAAGILDWLSAAAFQAEPALLVTGGMDADQSYYQNLNTNCDGRGGDIASLMRSRLIQYMLHNRAYIAVEFPESIEGETREEFLRRGAADAVLHALDAEHVVDWGCDGFGNLDWVKILRVDIVRDNPWSADADQIHTWTFVTRTGSYSYTACRDVKNNIAGQFKTKTASLKSFVKNDLGILPIVQISTRGGPWIMDRLAPIAVALFNREASLEFALDQSAYAMMVVNTNKSISEIVASEVAAIKLSPDGGESVTFAAPPTEHFNALRTACEHLQTNLYLSVQAMALQAAANDSNGRQSGVAKFRDFGAIAILISTFAAAIRDGLERSLRVIRAARQDGCNVSIAGLNQFDIQSRDVVMNLAKTFLDIPNIPETARRWTLGQVSDLMLVDAPPSMRSSARTEALHPIDEVQTKEIEINGAVAQGILSLMNVLITPSEARAKLGFSVEMPPELSAKNVIQNPSPNVNGDTQ